MESLIPFLAMIAYAVITWYLKKRQSEKDADRTAPTPGDEGKEWDELLEALGQKPSKKPPEPVKSAPTKIPTSPANYPNATPPPVLKKSTAEIFPETSPQAPIPPRSPQAFNPEQLLEEEMKSLEETMMAPSSPLPRTPLLQLDTPQANHEFVRINQLVRNRKTLKDAVILNEVLQPPLALRP